LDDGPHVGRSRYGHFGILRLFCAASRASLRHHLCIALLLTLLALPLLGEKVHLRRWIAVLVGLCGVLVVLQPGSTNLNLGHFAAMAAAVGGAFASVIVRKIGREERTVVIMLYPMMANFLVMGRLLHLG